MEHLISYRKELYLKDKVSLTPMPRFLELRAPYKVIKLYHIALCNHGLNSFWENYSTVQEQVKSQVESFQSLERFAIVQ